MITSSIIVIFLLIVSTTAPLTIALLQKVQAQGEFEGQIEAQLNEFLRCWNDFSAMGPLDMPADYQYYCGGLMISLQQELAHIYESGTTDTYSPHVQDLMVQAGNIIASNLCPPGGCPTTASPGPGPILSDDPFFEANEGVQSSGDLVQPGPFNPQQGTERQCTETGTCVDVPGGGPAAMDPQTGDIINLPGSGEIPPNSGLMPLFPDTP